jgi:hypothetical protein
VHSVLSTHHPPANQSTTLLTPEHRAPRRVRHAKFYVVRPGDTLSAISVKTHVSISRLLSLNPLVSPNSLQTGQRLRLRR